MSVFSPYRQSPSRIHAMLVLMSVLVMCLSACHDDDSDPAPAPSLNPALELQSFEVVYDRSSDSLRFSADVLGNAGSVIPVPAGQIDGAPVLAYVFPTTLSPEQVGFHHATGTVALAATSHPDFDDTPLWNEDGNASYDDDGAVYHAHWVLLESYPQAPAGLAVVQSRDPANLPPTAPMPMYLDSPGFTVVEGGQRISIIVPLDRVQRAVDFQVGALVADMRVDASGTLPRLQVEAILSAIDGGAARHSIKNVAAALDRPWPVPANDTGAWQVSQVETRYVEETATHLLQLDTVGLAATAVPTAIGAVDGAPVWGYAFLTDLPPSTVGFAGRDADGTLALAVTTHPDFDDTPLFDESLDGDYGNDGAVYHVHWVVLVADAASPGGLSVPSQSDANMLPPTAPMPMYLDSPGFHAFAKDRRLTVAVPGWHIGGLTAPLAVDAVAARLRVDASGPGPVLRLESIASSGSNRVKIAN